MKKYDSERCRICMSFIMEVKVMFKTFSNIIKNSKVPKIGKEQTSIALREIN